MKTTFFLSMLGLAATALAGPLPGSDGEALDSNGLSTLHVIAMLQYGRRLTTSRLRARNLPQRCNCCMPECLQQCRRQRLQVLRRPAQLPCRLPDGPSQLLHKVLLQHMQHLLMHASHSGWRERPKDTPA